MRAGIANLEQRVRLDRWREQRRPHGEGECLDARADRLGAHRLDRVQRERDELELGLARDGPIHARAQRRDGLRELGVRLRRAAAGDELVDRSDQRAMLVVVRCLRIDVDLVPPATTRGGGNDSDDESEASHHAVCDQRSKVDAHPLRGPSLDVRRAETLRQFLGVERAAQCHETPILAKDVVGLPGERFARHT